MYDYVYDYNQTQTLQNQWKLGPYIKALEHFCDYFP